MRVETATFTIARDHPSLEGHFPGRPVVPGVVLLDHVFAVICEALGAPSAVVRLQKVKFVSPLSPGEEVTVRFRRVGDAAGAGIAFGCLVADRPIATGTLGLDAASAPRSGTCL